MSGPVTIDIGYLAGETHRQAFAEIFAKVLKDNATLFVNAELARVESERPVREGVAVPSAARDVIAAPARLALALYNSGNESVRLVFGSPGSTLEIGIRFDNPEFWLE